MTRATVLLLAACSTAGPLAGEPDAPPTPPIADARPTPDRPANRMRTPAGPGIARRRGIAMDDPLASHVDYTSCPGQAPPGAPLQGSWRAVNAHVRVMAFCSMHPAQIGGIIHFGEGSI